MERKRSFRRIEHNTPVFVTLARIIPDKSNKAHKKRKKVIIITLKEILNELDKYYEEKIMNYHIEATKHTFGITREVSYIPEKIYSKESLRSLNNELCDLEEEIKARITWYKFLVQ